MTTLIKNRKQFDRFVAVLPELERDEVYFLSLSARNKYLTDTEREEYSLGRTEMFSRHTAFDKEGINLAIRKMEADLETKMTRGGHPIPEKALVVYFNIHPSSMIRAYASFKNQMDRHYDEVMQSLMNGNSEPHYHPFAGMRTKLMNHIQKSPSRKVWVDIDVDGPASPELDQAQYILLQVLNQRKLEFMQIWTQGGFHLMVKISEQMKMANIFKHINDADSILKRVGGEAKFNSNAMIPLPGTQQAGHDVIFLHVDD